MAEEVDVTLDSAEPDMDLNKIGKARKKNLPVLILIILLVLAAQTVAAYYTVSFLFFSNAPPLQSIRVPGGMPGAESDSSMVEESVESTGEIYEFTDIIVNPAGTLGRRYFVVSMSFEVSTKKVLEEISAKEPLLRDALITLLAQKSLEYLADISNMENIRSEIINAVNSFLEKGKIIRIYFTGYILQ